MCIVGSEIISILEIILKKERVKKIIKGNISYHVLLKQIKRWYKINAVDTDRLV